MSQSIRYLFIFASQTKQSSIILSNLTNILDNEEVLIPIGLYALCRVYADNKQTVKVDGQVIDKTITEITFDGDNVTLSYADNSSDTMDMSLVSLSFTYGTSAGIHQVEQLKEALQGKVYNLNGQLVGNSAEGLSKGVYIVNGKKVIIK